MDYEIKTLIDKWWATAHDLKEKKPRMFVYNKIVELNMSFDSLDEAMWYLDSKDKE